MERSPQNVIMNEMTDADIVFVCKPYYKTNRAIGDAAESLFVRFAYRDGVIDEEAIVGIEDSYRWFEYRLRDGAIQVEPDRLVELAATIRAAIKTVRPRIHWSEAQVASMNGYQECGYFHPFTCGNCSNTSLKATKEGWICPNDGCDYTQDWCHTFMADSSWRRNKGKAT